MFLEAIAHALLRSHPFQHAAINAAVLAGRNRLGGEVVDARSEAVFYETAKSLIYLQKKKGQWMKEQRGREKRGIRGGMHTPINSFTWRFCMRCSRVRCSACVNLLGGIFDSQEVDNARLGGRNGHVHDGGGRLERGETDIRAVRGGLWRLMEG